MATHVQYRRQGYCPRVALDMSCIECGYEGNARGMPEVPHGDYNTITSARDVAKSAISGARRTEEQPILRTHRAQWYLKNKGRL